VSDTEAKFQRRPDERPGEIVAAAMEEFAEKGFAAAKLDAIARRAGVSKGALYLYFDTKEDIFRAVVRDAVAPNVTAMRAMAHAYEGPFAELAPMILARLVAVADTTRLPAVAKMVIAESRNFPDLARAWHDSVVSEAVGVVSDLIARAQARGEIRPGRPRFYAFSLIGPMLMGFLWRETFQPIGAEPIDLAALARQHVDTVLAGMLARPEDAA
jgi:AcrR family transcriptional regulator